MASIREIWTKALDHFSRFDKDGNFRGDYKGLPPEAIAEHLSPEFMNGLYYLKNRVPAFEFTCTLVELPSKGRLAKLESAILGEQGIPTVKVSTNTYDCGKQVIFYINAYKDGSITPEYHTYRNDKTVQTAEDALERVARSIFESGLMNAPLNPHLKAPDEVLKA